MDANGALHDVPWTEAPTTWHADISELFSTLAENKEASPAGADTQPELETLTTYKLYVWLWTYANPLLIIGGGISNILAVIVLQSHLFRGTGTTFLLTALAVADLTVLMNNAMRHWLNNLTDGEINMRTYSDVGCRIQLFVTYFSPQWSAWTLVLVTAERAVSVWWPFKAKILCSRKRIVMAWILFTLIVAAVNFPIMAKYKLFVYHFPQSDDTIYTLKACLPTSQYFQDTVLSWTDFAMLNAGPSCFIFFFNIFIIVRLARPEIDRKNTTRAKKTVTSVTVMLLVVSIIFLVTTTPVVAYFLGADTFFKDSGTNVYVLGDRYLAYAVTNLLAYVNNSINFLLYFLSGARFRKAFKQMFCGRCMKTKANGTGAKTNSSSQVDGSIPNKTVSRMTREHNTRI